MKSFLNEADATQVNNVDVLLTRLVNLSNNYRTTNNSGFACFKQDSEVKDIVGKLVAATFTCSADSDASEASKIEAYLSTQLDLPSKSGVYHTIDTSGDHAITHFSTDLSSVDAESFPEPVFHNVSGWYATSEKLSPFPQHKYYLKTDIVAYNPYRIEHMERFSNFY